jgi:phytoene synthase
MGRSIAGGPRFIFPMSAADPTYVKDVARKSGSSFYFSFFSLPEEKRDAITAVYAFCREADDAVDEPGDQDPNHLLAEWRAELARTYDGHPSRPLTRSLSEAIIQFDLTRIYFEGILSGCEMDLTTLRYPTFDTLYTYCYHVASEVGLLCMEIFGYRSERMKDYAVKLGLAFQLTNILRDVGTDAERGRIYLPLEDLERFNVSEDDILQKRVTDNFRRLMAFEARRAWTYYHATEALPTPAERPAICAAEIMRAVYSDVLKRIEKNNYDVYSTRIRVPTPLKLWLALKTWWFNR